MPVTPLIVDPAREPERIRLTQRMLELRRETVGVANRGHGAIRPADEPEIEPQLITTAHTRVVTPVGEHLRGVPFAYV